MSNKRRIKQWYCEPFWVWIKPL